MTALFGGTGRAIAVLGWYVLPECFEGILTFLLFLSSPFLFPLMIWARGMGNLFLPLLLALLPSALMSREVSAHLPLPGMSVAGLNLVLYCFQLLNKY